MELGGFEHSDALTVFTLDYANRKNHAIPNLSITHLDVLALVWGTPE